MDIKLFESGEFADCKVTCKDWEFETHRLILSSRSQYFCKALNGEWEEAQKGEIKLNDHEPEKIEWLLRFIYHQDLEWHRTEGNSRDGFLPMLIELIILGDYFLVNGLVDVARDAILDTCSGFAVEIWSLPGEPTRSTLEYEIVPSFDEMTTQIMKAITLTSAASGPTQPFRKFLVKFVVDVFGCTPGISAWSHAETLVFRRQLRLAAKLRDLAIGMPDLENELKAALFDSSFPRFPSKNSYPRQWDDYYTPDDVCSVCSRHLGGDKEGAGLIFGPFYDSGKQSCCLHCAKSVLDQAWWDFMMDDGGRRALLTEPDEDSSDPPDTKASK